MVIFIKLTLTLKYKKLSLSPKIPMTFSHGYTMEYNIGTNLNKNRD